MSEDLTSTQIKGKKHYWRAVVIWGVGTIGATALYAMAPRISLPGKVIIAGLLIGSAVLLFKANAFSRYAVGLVALLGMLGSFPGACAVFDPETQTEGIFALTFLIICGYVWHALLISDDVTAYLKWFIESKNIKPSNTEIDTKADGGNHENQHH